MNKPKPHDVLTRRQREILTIMRDKDEDLLYEHGRGFIGQSSVAPRTVFALLRMCAIHSDSMDDVYYHITGTGLKLLNNDTSDLKLLAEETLKAVRP